MCGITGFWSPKKSRPSDELHALVLKMADVLKQRGPDSSGVWCDVEQNLSFGHRRLSVVDLSPAGHQPMISKSGRFIISYNGEIYNTEELKLELMKAGLIFRGHSDTEVILEGAEYWGVESLCQKLIGMFAFSLWDKLEKKLFLARDRLGIKPLYWGYSGETLFFGSQLKSFFPHPDWQGSISPDALTAYFRFNYVPAPLSIFKDIYKLSPGTILTFDQHQNAVEKRFWNFEKVISVSRMKAQRQDEHYIEELESLLKDAVKRRMVADVPLGAFLSGGIDSSLVVALMQSQSSLPIKTFSIGFNEAGYNEAPFAAIVAKHLHTEHHELYLESKDAEAVIPGIPQWCDEPFADVSQIPTYLVSKLAREKVTVSLSGDGGDEGFGGYTRYFLGQKLWTTLSVFPFWLRHLIAEGIRVPSPHMWDSFARILPNRMRPSLLSDKLYKLSNLLITKHPDAFYQSLVSHWDKPETLVQGGIEPQCYPWGSLNQENFKRSDNIVEWMQAMDTLSYLPDDILTKVDRASMAVSLEARVPLLDHRVIEYAWKLPFNCKIRNNQGKWILRQILAKYVPSSMMERPKMGFGVPIDHWLRGDLKAWAEHLLFDQKLQHGLNFSDIHKRWKEHLGGKRNWQYSLWGVLMFQAWREEWGF